MLSMASWAARPAKVKTNRHQHLPGSTKPSEADKILQALGGVNTNKNNDNNNDSSNNNNNSSGNKKR